VHITEVNSNKIITLDIRILIFTGVL